MGLSSDLLAQFAKVTNDTKKTKSEATVTGTIAVRDDNLYVRIDGSDSLTPVATTTDAEDGDRVHVLIKDHMAVVTGNVTSPSARSKDLKVVDDKVEASSAKIDNLEADNVTINGKLDANEAKIKDLEADNVTISGKLDANEAEIEDLKAGKLSATDAELKYANIDFANIGEAAIKQFYAKSGVIEDVVISDGHVTGTLVGVTIKGDLIEGGTVVADKLVIKGEDGLFYKLNTNGMDITAEQTEYNSLNGTIITAKSITAEKVNIDDLVAFNATIGGFKITSDAIYSGVKESAANTTRGIYMDNTGQFAIGDASNFLKYFKDTDGAWKLRVSADSLEFSTGGTVEDKIDQIQSDVDSLKDEITTSLRIESSRGTVFKNDQVATVLSVVIYHGSQRLTTSAEMKSVFGNGAYLQWYWQRMDDETYGVLSAADSRFEDNSFRFVLSPEDVDAKVTFRCELIV